MTDSEIDILAERIAARLWPKLRELFACQPQPIARKLTVAEFAQCIQRMRVLGE